MLGLALREASECHRCGGDLAETLDWQWKWEPQPPSVCLRCLALQQADKGAAKHPHHGAMIHHVKKSVRPQPKNRKKRRR